MSRKSNRLKGRVVLLEKVVESQIDLIRTLSRMNVRAAAEVAELRGHIRQHVEIGEARALSQAQPK